MDARGTRARADVSHRALLSGLDYAPDSMLVLSSLGVIEAANVRVPEVLGWSSDELTGTDLASLIVASPAAGDVDVRLPWHADGRRARRLTLDLRHRDGHVVPVEVTVATVPTTVGTRYLAALRDVSGALRDRRAAQQLAAIDDLKDALIETVAYELRSPLAAVMGFVELLRREPPTLSFDDRRELLERLWETADRMDQRLRSLLDLERVTNGALRPRPARVSVRAAVDEARRAHRSLTSRQTHVDVPDLHLEVDPDQLRSLLDALLRNAIRHTPPATPVWIRARTDGGEHVLLSVEDAGPGIPDEDKERLFEPYRAGEAPALSVTGLSLVARLAALNGGSAWVEDRPGGGTAFRLRLPAG